MTSWITLPVMGTQAWIVPTLPTSISRFDHLIGDATKVCSKQRLPMIVPFHCRQVTVPSSDARTIRDERVVQDE